MTAQGPPYLSGDRIATLLPYRDAVTLLAEALASGAAPGRTPPRSAVTVNAGELLLMPAELGGFAGVKVASVRGPQAVGDRPRIQGLYLLFDGGTLAPVATVDAVALTLLRTAAVSALAVRHLAEPDASRMVVFGTGPQAWAHVQAFVTVRPVRHVTVVGRRQEPAEALAGRCRDAGITAGTGDAGAVADADLVACCTTAREPVFDSRLLPDHATVVAMGSHEPSAREVDADLVRRATVVVESRSSAMREAGDVLLAIAEGVAEADTVDGELPALARGHVPVAPGRPRLFKSVGEGWGDLVLAGAAYQRSAEG
jgi:ornithine cyclodeaminase